MDHRRLTMFWINLRKRGANQSVRAIVDQLISERSVDLLLLQESTAGGRRLPDTAFQGMKPLMISGDLSMFAKRKADEVRLLVDHPRWVICSWRDIRIVNVHLSPYSSSQRRTELAQLASTLRAGKLLLGGDFNITPNREDAEYAGGESNWSPPAEKLRFAEFLQELKLTDILTFARGGGYTVERRINGREARFRCDMLLASRSQEAQLKASYVHETRLGPLAFTDHSAIQAKLEIEEP